MKFNKVVVSERMSVMAVIAAKRSGLKWATVARKANKMVARAQRRHMKTLLA